MGKPHAYGAAPHIPDGLWDHLWGGPTLMGWPHTFLMDFGVTYGAAPHVMMDFGVTYGAAPHIMVDFGVTYGAAPHIPDGLWDQLWGGPTLMGQPHTFLMDFGITYGPHRPPSPLMGRRWTPSSTYGAEVDPQCYLWGSPMDLKAPLMGQTPTSDPALMGQTHNLGTHCNLWGRRSPHHHLWGSPTDPHGHLWGSHR